MKWKSSLTISLFNFHYLPYKDAEKVDAKNEDEDEKNWKNEFDFWILHIKIRLYENFLKIWSQKKKNFHPLFKLFLTNRGKNENVNEKIWENEFDLWILQIKIRVYVNFHENLWEKNFGPFWRTFLTNWGKNEDEKIWEN